MVDSYAFSRRTHPRQSLAQATSRVTKRAAGSVVDGGAGEWQSPQTQNPRLAAPRQGRKEEKHPTATQAQPTMKLKPSYTLTPDQRKMLMATICIKCGKEIPFVDMRRSKYCSKCRKGRK